MESISPPLQSGCTLICFQQQNVVEGILWDFSTLTVRDPAASAAAFFGTHVNHGKKLGIKDYLERLRCHSSLSAEAPWWVTKDIWDQPDCHQSSRPGLLFQQMSPLDKETLTLDFSFLVPLTSTWNVSDLTICHDPVKGSLVQYSASQTCPRTHLKGRWP